ncbi:MAG: hypothetical protein KDE27_06460 [Planctomycetes bacterium]|nr:hypothetical protein [Planctomycetota bacterium]
MERMGIGVSAIMTLSTSVFGQATHVVGPGGFAEIRDALAVAQVDDTIVVQPGAYSPFVASLGVRIVAPDGATVTTNYQSSPSEFTGFQPPSGQTVYVHGLTFAQVDAIHPHFMRATSGQVAFDHCTFPPTHPFKSHYTLVVNAADIVLISCTFSGFSGAVSVTSGSLAAVDCAFYGVDPQSSSFQPAAVHLQDATAQLSFCELKGGNVINAFHEPGSGLWVGGSSAVSLVACVVEGGDRPAGVGGVAASGAVNTGSQPIRHMNTSFVGGAGTVYLPNAGWWPIRGLGTEGPEVAATLIGLAPLIYGLEAGNYYGFAAMTTPATPVLCALTFELTAPTAVPGILQRVRFDPAGVISLGLTVTTPQGIDSRTLTQSVPSLIGLPIWIHGLMFDGVAVQSAAPVGGLVN